MGNHITRKAHAMDLDAVDADQAAQDFRRLWSLEFLGALRTLVTLDTARALKPYLEVFPQDTHAKTRALAFRYVEFCTDESNFTKTRKQAARELSERFPNLRISDASLKHIEWKWPGIWSVVATIVQKKLRDAEARVGLATLHHAVNGTHQDRRLFYELQGKLKKSGTEGAGVTFIFNNTSVQRPQVSVIDAEALEPLGAEE